MQFTVTEIGLITVQILIIPFARYFFQQYKKEVLDDAYQIINEHYLSLQSLIDHNKDNIKHINTRLTHRAEVMKLKSKIVNSRLKDIEQYLAKQNGFQPRNDIDLDSEDNSGLF